jgi:hypothetical protein
MVKSIEYDEYQIGTDNEDDQLDRPPSLLILQHESDADGEGDNEESDAESNADEDEDSDEIDWEKVNGQPFDHSELPKKRASRKKAVS